MENEQALTPGERAAILAEWDRLAGEPRPKSRPPYGCATFLMATALFLLVHQLPKLGWTLPPTLQTILLWALGIVIAGGLLLGLFAGSGIFAGAAVRAEESIAWLAGHPATSDATERRRHAVTMLYFALVSDGPTTSGTFDPDPVSRRLGENFSYVVAVERALVEERRMWPVFRATAHSESRES